MVFPVRSACLDLIALEHRSDEGDSLDVRSHRFTQVRMMCELGLEVGGEQLERFDGQEMADASSEYGGSFRALDREDLAQRGTDFVFVEAPTVSS